ncbi:MAG: CBS domain-containing protein [Candidatus Manganitrophus sp.]|nr:CBS domain-containing protein [Candidatus Manganitrophus sp.]MDC4223786.1 CBS domain-containing protein [Candidatus Manganitrophus sp.]WDT69677.1 MAG: CBS domain-containing protein [Candidatus Manganitrophus sp.]WDT74108.1 MAG: CBS domain-containing protein [Candidatus Manganitrophus sp.]WDT78709.1 MAG: CBS domain-containing protein [Candidatus Manganitrophus sp.]
MKVKSQEVGQIRLAKPRFVKEYESAFDIAAELLDSGHAAIPVVTREGRVIGMVNDQDLLRLLPGPRRLEEIKAKEIMSRVPAVIDEETSLAEASKIMENLQLQRLPVVREGILIGTITRHDLLRARLGWGTGEWE